MNKRTSTSIGVSLVLILSQFSSSHARSQEEGVSNGDASKIGILPQDRVGSNVSDSETNPFSLPIQRKQEVAQKKQYSQEDLIRQKFASLRVTGVVESGGKKTILLDDMILRENELVRPVIVGQKEQLIVKEITNETIEFVFAEPQNRNRKPRSLIMEINLDPQVMALLPGHTESPEKPFDFVRDGQEFATHDEE